MIAPRDDFAGSVDPGLQEVETGGTVVIVVHVVFARPKQLYGNAERFGDVGGFDHVVVGETPAEAAADAGEVNGDVGLLHADRSQLLQAALRASGWAPRLRACRP